LGRLTDHRRHPRFGTIGLKGNGGKEGRFAAFDGRIFAIDLQYSQNYLTSASKGPVFWYRQPAGRPLSGGVGSLTQEGIARYGRSSSHPVVTGGGCLFQKIHVDAGLNAGKVAF
jgi:hypothetical protein